VRHAVLHHPRPSFFGLEFSRFAPEGGTAFHEFFGLEFSSLHRIIFLYYIILILALITNLVTLRLRKLPVGRAWEALREDEIACRSLGINPTNTKLTAFAIGAMSSSFIWFFGLGYGARVLEPLFAKPSAWRVLDGLIALVMAALSVSLLVRFFTG